MPEVLISSSSTTASAVSPPAVAFQPQMRILKRPSSQNSSSNLSSSQTPAESLAQREARYQAARERIFGGDDGSENVSEDGSGKLKRGVIRNPVGPSENSKDAGDGQIPKGFKPRSTKGQGSSEPVV